MATIRPVPVARPNETQLLIARHANALCWQLGCAIMLDPYARNYCRWCACALRGRRVPERHCLPGLPDEPRAAAVPGSVAHPAASKVCSPCMLRFVLQDV